MDLYPKDFEGNMSKRVELLQLCKRNKTVRDQTKQVFHSDVIFAFNMFFYTLDVRKRPLHNQPFCTYPYQDEMILEVCESIDTGKDILIEKSRDMGVSWMVILIYLWYWLKPEGGTDFLLGSRIEDYVDKRGDMRTLMEKARYGLYKLPKWLYPKGFNDKKHDNYMKLQNPESSASITGESNNANFSTGGRYASVLLDEFAKWEVTDKPAWTAAGDATPCRIPVSTPFGASGQYYELATSTKTPRVTLHWSLHPEKGMGAYCPYPKPEVLADLHAISSPWFKGQEERRTQLEIDQELQINYIGAGRPVYDGKASKALVSYQTKHQASPSPVRFYDLLQDRYEEEITFRNKNDLLFIYKKFDPDCSYVMSLDVAEGKESGDYSVALLLNRHTFNVDAIHHGVTNEIQLASFAHKIALMYCKDVHSMDAPCIAPETNGPGLATFDRLQMMAYVNLFMMPRFDVTKQSTTFKKGWKTDLHSRPALIASIREYLEGGWGELNYPELIRELMTFTYSKQGKPEARPGCHDDLVMAFGIALQVHASIPMAGKTRIILTNQDKYINDFDLDEFKEDYTPTLQEACFEQAVTKRKRVVESDLFF